MKRFFGTFVAVALALGLTACGDDDDDIGGFADGAPEPDASLVPDGAPGDGSVPDADPLAPDAAAVDDGEGPLIDIVTPEPGELISGVITIAATVTDPSGVDGSSVIATVAFAHEVPLLNTSGSTYSGLFDTTVLSSGLVYPNLDVRAQDSFGNESHFGQEVALDNQPPLMSLDPPLMREATFDDATGGLLCSRLFDPLGDDSIDDGESVAQLSEIRVRIEDVGNGASAASSVELPIAHVDPSSVQLYVLDDEGAALLVDTDADGFCDAINPAITPAPVPMTDTEAAVVNMVAIGPRGASHFAAPVVAFNSFELGEGCVEPGDSPFPPDICLTVEAIRVIRDQFGPTPVIYGIPPLTERACMGNAFDSAAANVSDGWACLAVRAADNMGNVGVSPPLRVCFDVDGDGAEGCAGWGTISTPPVSCTDGCTVESFADFAGFQLRRIDF